MCAPKTFTILPPYQLSVGSTNTIVVALDGESSDSSDIIMATLRQFQTEYIYPNGLSNPLTQGLAFGLIIIVSLMIAKNSSMNQPQILTTHFTNLAPFMPTTSTGDFSNPLLTASSVIFLYAVALQMLLFGQTSNRLYDWSGRIWNSPKMNKVASVEGLTGFKSCLSFSAIRSSMSSTSVKNLLSLSGGAMETKQLKGGPTALLSSTDLFLPVDDVSNLTLLDMKDILRFMIDMNQADSTKRRLLSTLRRNAQKAAAAIEVVVTASKGRHIQLSSKTTTSHHRNHPNLESAQSAGDIDALAFAAFVRIFAEWRSLRLVPDGYATYAIGMGLAKRDLLQNVEKIETAVHEYVRFYEQRHHSHGERNIASPTLRQLLQFELENQKHPHLPCLMDKSAASGVLWIQRQLQYQARIFNNLSQIPLGVYPSAKEAVLAAYKSTFDLYHGFMLRQIFQRTVNAAPSADVILQHMNLPYSYYDNDEKDDHDIVADTPAVEDEDDDKITDDAWIYVPVEPPLKENIENDDRKGKMKHLNANPIEKFGIHITNEWLKFQMFINQCSGHSTHHNSNKNAFRVVSVSSLSMSNLIACDSQVLHAPMREHSAIIASKRATGENDITTYLATAQPFLDGVDKLLTEFNMKDPSRC